MKAQSVKHLPFCSPRCTHMERPNTRYSRQRLRRSLYRGFLILLVGLFSTMISQTRRCG